MRIKGAVLREFNKGYSIEELELGNFVSGFSDHTVVPEGALIPVWDIGGVGQNTLRAEPRALQA